MQLYCIFSHLCLWQESARFDKSQFQKVQLILFDSNGRKDEHTLVIFFDTVKHFLFLK